MKMVTCGENNGMYGKTHSEETIKKQKYKAIGRFTLEWFVDRYGKREGKKKYNLRRSMLSNRKINYVYDNGQKGIPKGIPSDISRQKMSETKNKMKIIKKLLIEDIKSCKYTVLQLCKKYDIGETAVKYNKKKLKQEGKL